MAIIRSRGAVQPMPRNGATIPISALRIKENMDSINTKLFTPYHKCTYRITRYHTIWQGILFPIMNQTISDGETVEFAVIFALPGRPSCACGHATTVHK